jgi:hypothetical protein
MPPRLVLIGGSLLIVLLLAVIPVAYLLGRSSAAGRQAGQEQPGPSAPDTSPANPEAERPPAAGATGEPAAAPAEAKAEAPAPASPSHAKGGLLGGLVSAVGDEAAAGGKRIADDLDAQGHALVDKARSDALAALTKTVDHAVASVDSAADELEQKARQALAAEEHAALHEPREAAQAALEDPAFTSFVDGVTKQEAANAAALATLSAGISGDLAAAAKALSAKAHAVGDSIRRQANPATLLHGGALPDEAAIARDLDKQVAQVRAALEAFTAATDAVRHRCDDAIARLRQGMADERAKVTAQLNQAAAASEKQIASLRSRLSADITQAVAAAASPFDDEQARPKMTKPGR